MAIVVFLLGLILLSCGAGGVYASIDLQGTDRGLLYAGVGSIALSAGLVVIILGVVIRRVDRLAASLALAPAPSYEQPAPPESEAFGPAVEEVAAPAQEAVEEEAVNENRAGHLPSLDTPEAPPTLVGRYTAGGANYMIFSDGSIEAETSEGTFKFASMGDFKKHIAGRPG